jgi:hypothetical protein
MDTNILSEDRGEKRFASRLHEFEQAHKEDLAAIVKALAKITSRTPEEVKPHFDTMLEHLVQPHERPFYETATPQEWVRAFKEWAASHDSNSPCLSDEAISRESIYGERG